MAKQKLLKVLFLGGLGEIGKNMTALEYGDSILIVDAGMSFPTEETPGVDVIVPDITYLRQNKDKVKGIVLTHGHEDHIGALPYLLEELKVPVYGTRFTLGIVQNKIIMHDVSSDLLKTVEENSTVDVDIFKVEFIKVCHSIAMASSISITTPVGVVFFTGDFKMDYTPVDGKFTNIRRIGEIGNKGVLLMLGESTNVEREGHSKSESMVAANLDNIFNNHKDRRLIIATFATNNYRVQTILNLAAKYGRKVLLSGRSMENIAEMAAKIGELHYNKDLFVDNQRASKLPPEKLVVISTGTQGEPMSALTRMSQGEFNKVTIGEKDTVILSSSPIPGNERFIYSVINNLYRMGAEVIYEAMYDIHATGHAFKEELKLMLQLVRPKYFMPVHGEYRHQKKHAALAISLGIPESNIFIPEIGSAIGINEHEFKKLSNIPAGSAFVDGILLGVDATGILKDRRALADDGIVIALASVSMSSGELISGPDIITRGFMIKEEDGEAVKSAVTNSIKGMDFGAVADYIDIKKTVRKALRKFITLKYGQYPMILPIIIEA